MTLIEIRNCVRTLQAQGLALPDISGLLGLSRNSVRAIMRVKADPAPRSAGPGGKALRWYAGVANAKLRRVPRMSAEDAYGLEVPHLNVLPSLAPANYEVFIRVVIGRDLCGFVSVGANRYAVPGRLLGKKVVVYMCHERVEVHHRGASVASHPRLVSVLD